MTLRHIGLLSALLWCATGLAQAQERGDRAFQQLDADGDGQITREEFKQQAPRLLNAMKQGQKQPAPPEARHPEHPAPEARSPEAEVKDLDKQIERILDKKLNDKRTDRPGQGPGALAGPRGPRGPGAQRMRGRDADAPRRGPMSKEEMMAHKRGAGRGPGFGQQHRTPGAGPRAMGRGPQGAYGFGKGTERGKAWADGPRGAEGRGFGGRGPALQGQGPAAMLDANRDGRIDAVELDRLIDKLQAVRAKVGDGGIPLEAFRDQMMAGRGPGRAAAGDRAARDAKRDAVRDKEKPDREKPDKAKPDKVKPERERPRDGKGPGPRDGDKPRPRDGEGPGPRDGDR